MSDDDRIVVVFPKLTRWAKRMCIAVAALFVVHGLYALLLQERLGFRPLAYLALAPERVFTRYELWRVASYALFDPALDGTFWSLLMCWWFLSPVEARVGAKRLGALIAAGVFGGAAFALLAARVHSSLRLGVAMGLGSIDAAMLAAWGILLRNEPMSLLGVVKMRGRHLALLFGGLLVVSSLYAGSVDGMTRIGGLLAGALATRWIERNPPRGSGVKPSSSRRSGGDPKRRFEVHRGGRDADPTRWN